MGGNFKFTSESVTEGHSDKVCDLISDAILDAYLEQDFNSRVACECAVKDNNVIVFGEITSLGDINIDDIIKNTIKEIGYDNSRKYGFDWESCNIINLIGKQSLNIAQGVNKEEQGAGDQGMMFGYANRDTKELMPIPIMLAHCLTARLTKVRKEKILPFLRPDGKSQITVNYDNFIPRSIERITIAAQHDDIDIKEIREGVIEEVIKKVIPGYLLVKGRDIKDISCINGTGKFVIGGPSGDAGLTGRKIIVDSYGGFARHGGGCFSGKDPSKVDRSGAYISRYIAKNIVAAGLAMECEISLAYTIGKADPDNININTFGTGIKGDKELEKIIRDVFPLKPAEIISQLKLRNPIYKSTASYGHFGREPFEENRYKFFSWEKTDKVDELKKYAKI